VSQFTLGEKALRTDGHPAASARTATVKIDAVTNPDDGTADDVSQWTSLCGSFQPTYVNCAFKRSDWTYWSAQIGGGSVNGHLLTWAVDPSSGRSYQIEFEINPPAPGP
jgi:hypothetical protein